MNSLLCRWQEFESATKLSEFRQIFFSSSARQQFNDDIERESFFQSWTNYYFTSCIEDIWVATNARNKLLGYLTGCPNSIMASPFLQANNSNYNLFADLFAQFPAHLHINFSSEARGQGLGSKLIEAFVNYRNTSVHIVTSPEARNVSFYRKNAFTFEIIRESNGKKLLFMGRRL